MAITPVYGWRYLALGDPPNIAQLGENLALDIEATLSTIPASVVDHEARLDTIEGAWTAYVTGWATFGAAPVLGNGALVSRYKQVGKTVDLSIKLTIGSTTNPQAGQLWRFTAPVTAATDAVFPIGLEDNSSGFRWPGVAVLGSGGLGIDRVVQSSVTGSAGVTGDSPFAWAAGDIFWLNGTYEAA